MTSAFHRSSSADPALTAPGPGNQNVNAPASDGGAPGRGQGLRLYIGWQLLKLAVAALLAYAIWRGYQNPDLLLDLSSWRLC